MDLGTNNDDRAQLADIADAKHQGTKATAEKHQIRKMIRKVTMGRPPAWLMNCGAFAFFSAELKSKDLEHRTIGPRDNSLGLKSSFKTAIQTPPPRHG